MVEGPAEVPRYGTVENRRGTEWWRRESIPYFAAAARCTARRIRIVFTPMIRGGFPGGSLPLLLSPSLRLSDILSKIRHRGYRTDGTCFTAAARWNGPASRACLHLCPAHPRLSRHCVSSILKEFGYKSKA